MKKLKPLPALLGVVAGLGVSGLGVAAPVQLTQAQFVAQTAGLPTQVETFEGFTVGIHSSPFTILNGTYTAPAPSVVTSNPIVPFCGTANTSQCLIDGLSVTALRTFGAFPAGTDYWAANMAYISPSDLFDVVVTGGSGVLTLSSVAAASFVGFHDALGISSVSFQDLGTSPGLVGNFSFDNVTTAQVTLDEPVSLSLLGLGLCAIALTRRKRAS